MAELRSSRCARTRIGRLPAARDAAAEIGSDAARGAMRVPAAAETAAAAGSAATSAPSVTPAAESAQEADPAGAVLRCRARAAVPTRAGNWWTSGASSSRPTTPMCRPTSRRSAAKVSGYLAAVPSATTASRCTQGDVIARLDDGDYRLARRGRARQGRDPAEHDRRASAGRSRRSRRRSTRPRAQLDSAQADADPRRRPNSTASRR